jgi:hypothetical protein
MPSPAPNTSVDTLQVATIKSMQRYEAVFEYLRVSFVTSRTIYRNALEELLSPLALSDSQLYMLSEETDQSAWEEPKLASSIEGRLSHSYSPFKSSVKQLNKKVLLFGRKLQLENGFRVSSILQHSTQLTHSSRHGCYQMGASTSSNGRASSGIR